MGDSFLGLLDSGSSVSLLGDAGIALCKRRGVTTKASRTTVRFGRGACRVAGSVRLKVNWAGGKRRQRFLLVPGLSPAVILGRDFLAGTGMDLHISEGGWTCGSFPQRVVPFDSEGDDLVDCLVSSNVNPSNCEDSVRTLRELVANATCSPSEKQELFEMLLEFKDVFTSIPGKTTLIEHSIDTGDAKPRACHPRPVSAKKRAEVDKAIDELLDLGLIRPSYSPWSSPIVLVDKPDGSKRLCGDYRRLNDVTVPDRYPMPSIPDILSYLGSARWFSTFDLTKGFNQIEMAEDSMQKSAIVCHRGLFEYTKMPFGLRNAPATFMRLIDRVLGSSKWNHALGFYDDLVTYSTSFKDHLAHIRDVLSRIRDAGLTINPKKVQLCTDELSLLGYQLSPGKCRPNPDKWRAIEEFPEPRNVKALQRFLGMIGFYRQFVPDFAAAAKPLFTLLKKDAKWCWGEAQTKAMQSLIQRVRATSELALPDLNKPFLIQTDASFSGLGAILCQEGENGMLPISFQSRSLLPAERNYSVTELECLAVMYALKKFRSYVEGTSFVVETDHLALSWLKRLKDPVGRLARWSLELQAFDYEVRYRPGKLNAPADALSRAPLELEASGVKQEVALAVEETSSLWDFPVTRQILIESQATDSGLARIFAGLERVDGSNDPETAVAAGVMLDQYVKDRDGLLYRYFVPWNEDDEDEALEQAWKVVVPKSLRVSFIKYFHDEAIAGHLGVCKTYKRLQSRVTWSGMKRDVIKYVRGCVLCQKSKPTTQLIPGLLSSVNSVRPWELVTCDLMGPYTRSAKGNLYLLVVVCHFTKWTEFFPLRKMSSEKIIERLLEVFCRFGFPREILTDNGSVFTSKVFTESCTKLGIRVKHTSPYHPQANLTERINKTTKQMIVTFTESHKDWDARIVEFGFAQRTAESKSTGFTPAAPNFGRELRAPLDWELKREPLPSSRSYPTYAEKLKERLSDALDHAKRNLEDSRLQQKFQYDKRRRHVYFKRGDLVLRLSHHLSDASRGFTASLAKKWEGPYVVLDRTTPLTYRLGERDTNKFVGVTHVSQLKPFCLPVLTDKTTGPSASEKSGTPLPRNKRKSVRQDYRPPIPYNLRSRNKPPT